jgi:hypothetical protein
MDEAKDPDAGLRENWVKASRLALSAAFALFLLSRGAKVGANKILEAFGLDWGALNPYSVGLFGVPVIAVLCCWALWWARTYARRHSEEPWYARVVTKSDLGKVGEKARTLAGWSLTLYVLLPVIGLAALELKFLHGTFRVADSDAASCAGSRLEGVWLDHFWPPCGLRSVWASPYRYDGNLTYVPPWQAIIWVAAGIGVGLYALRYLYLVFRPACSHRQHP